MFLSGQAFYNFCDTSLDDRYAAKDSFSPKFVFLKHEDIQTFLQKTNLFKYDDISLVLHNSDRTFTNEDAKRLQPFVQHIYAVNSSCTFDFVTQIPLGLRDDQYTPHSDLVDILQQPQADRDIFCLANFAVATNVRERRECLQWAMKTPWVHTNTDYFNIPLGFSLQHQNSEIRERRKAFWMILRRCKFVLCPPGSGLDTHRVYESLVCGATPIVLDTPLAALHKSFGALVVNSWEDITLQMLQSFQPSSSNFAATKPLDFIVSSQN